MEICRIVSKRNKEKLHNNNKKNLKQSGKEVRELGTKEKALWFSLGLSFAAVVVAITVLVMQI